MSATELLPPPVTWAQRKHVVFLTICVEDCKSPDIKLLNDRVYFKGVGGPDKKNYENTLELWKEIEADKSKFFIRDRNIELILVKKDGYGPYWPHLLKDKKKMHWLKVDFSKWKDEDDSEDEGEGGKNQDLEEMMRSMGGLGGGGMDGERPSLDDLEDDSDDEELPDLE